MVWVPACDVADPPKGYVYKGYRLTEVPAGLKVWVCRCRSREAYTLANLWDITPAVGWFVCMACYLPAPLNALNAGLIRECDSCGDPYRINSLPDRYDLCDDCE